MSNVITAREAEERLRKGEKPPAGAILTPSARDVFSALHQSDFRISAEVIRMVLTRVGE